MNDKGNGWGTLYYKRMGIPKAIRVISRKLQLDHTFCPFAGDDGLPIEIYKELIADGIFDDVRLLLDKEDAYVIAMDEKIYIDQWISLLDVDDIIKVE
jgi:hypothetical protein